VFGFIQGQLDHEAGVSCQDVDESGSLLVSGTKEGQIILWDINSLYPIAEMKSTVNISYRIPSFHILISS
jgi:WD40 repeat protein